MTKKTEIVAIRLDHKSRCWLTYMASVGGCSVSQVIREALESHKEVTHHG